MFDQGRKLSRSLGRWCALGCLSLVLLGAWTAPARAERIKDLASVQGVRNNQLIGYGLVVGLDGSGDQTTQTPFTTQSIANMASGAQTLASRFQSLQSQLQGLYDGVNTQLQNTVSSINAYASQIAQLNQQIIVAQASSNQPANDLLDKRDELVSELNKLVGTTTVVDSNGAMNVFIGTGQQLVVGSSSQTLDARPSAADPQRYTVGILSNKSYLELPEDLLTGGSLAGLMSFRAESLDNAANTLGQIATSVALTFNAQQSLGQDMLGNTATSSSFAKNIFNYAQPQAWANGGNTGSGTLSATFTNPTLELNNGSFQMDYAGGSYTVTRKSDGSQWTGASLNSVMAISLGTKDRVASLREVAAWKILTSRPTTRATSNRGPEIRRVISRA